MRDPLTRTLLILTFVTGIVDVVSFLALGNVFAAMQTGNVIFLGLGVVGGHGAPVLAAVLASLADVHPGGLTAYVLIAILSVAMGLRNTIARGIGDPNLATTVLNLTLSAFVSATPTGIATESELTLRATAIGAILAGAIAGALLLKVSLALALAGAAAVVVAAAVSERFVDRPYTGAAASSRSISSR